MQKLLLLATVAALTVPMATSAPAQHTNWSHQDRTSEGYMLRRSAMRAGPDRDYPLVRMIPNGRSVNVFGCLNDWSWCDISYRGDRGWVEGRRLGADYHGQRRPYSSAGVYLGIGVLTFVIGDYWDNYYRTRPFYGQRPQWERHYQEHYRPQWGPRPSAPRPQDHQQVTPRGDHQWNGHQQPSHAAPPPAASNPDRPHDSGNDNKHDQRRDEKHGKPNGR